MRYLINSLILVAILLFGGSGLISLGYSKDYIKNSAEWYITHNLPNDERAITNNSEIRYLAKLSNHQLEALDLETANSFEYIILKVKAKDIIIWKKIAQLATSKKILVMNTFYNNRNDTVFIIKKLNLNITKNDNSKRTMKH